jgi:hypothetical protein
VFGGCGLCSRSSGYGSVSCCEHGNETSGSVNCEESFD